MKEIGLLWEQYEKVYSELIALWRDVILNNYRLFESTFPILNDGANIFFKIWFPHAYTMKLRNQKAFDPTHDQLDQFVK